MSAPKGNANARKGHHQRVSVPFSGKQLDAIYASIGLYGHENEPERVREAAQKLVHDALWNLNTACCFNGPKCHTGARELPTSEMVWCEINQHYGWYCQLCYDVEHSPRDEARATLAMNEQQEGANSPKGQQHMNNRLDPDYGKPWLPTDLPIVEAEEAEEETALTLEDGTPYERPNDAGQRRERTFPRPPSERPQRP
jgi:hypothetical protein